MLPYIPFIWVRKSKPSTYALPELGSKSPVIYHSRTIIDKFQRLENACENAITWQSIKKFDRAQGTMSDMVKYLLSFDQIFTNHTNEGSFAGTIWTKHSKALSAW